MSAIPDLAVRLKRYGASVLRVPAVGHLISAFYGDAIPVGDCVIHTDSPYISATTKADMFWGFYEGDEIGFVQRYLPPDRDVIELGASLGVVTSHIVRKVAQGGRRVISVEAVEALIPYAARNVCANASNSQITFIHGAIDYTPTEDRLIAFGVADTQWSRVGLDGSRVVRVPQVQLSRLLREQQLTSFTLVCDIEGAERQILDHDADALETCGLIIIELHDDVDGLLRDFGRLGYRTVTRSGLLHRGAVCVLTR